jgi:formate hydrogenlyase subunit 3/multisubunit Na+/H+ antiporter MnhD subunit
VTAEILDLARAHAPLLLVVVPLAGAAAAVAVPSPRLSWILATAAAWVAAAIAGDMAVRGVLAGVPVSVAREGVALAVDGVAAFAAPLIAAAAALATLAAGALLKDFSPRAAPFAMALTLCVSAGWTGALLARDFIALFLAAETAWLSAAGLAALSAERDRGALNGAWRMLGMGGAAAMLMLLGVGLIHRAVGGVTLEAIPAAQIAAPGVAAAGVGLVLLGLALKAGVAPLHAWAGAAYGRSGGLAAIVLGAVAATGALATLIRVAAHATQAPALGEGVAAALAALGATSIIIGSVQAVGSSNLGRLAAYAGASQAGGVLLAVALGSRAGFEAALIQWFALGAAMTALLAGGAVGRVGALAGLDGMGRRAPLASAAVTAGALSLMGAPLTIGFLGRWRLVEAGVGAEWWWPAGAVTFASLAGVFYGGRLIERLYFRRAGAAFAGDGSIWRLTLAPALAAAIAAVTLGLSPAQLLQAAGNAAGWLVGGTP